jgi:hypothetical protein
MVIYRFPPGAVRKLMAIHGLSEEDVLTELHTGQLTLPERLPLSPEEAQQELEDELIAAMTAPLPNPPHFTKD